MKIAKNLKGKDAGFSLLEVLVAIAILGVGTAVFSQYTQRISANRQAAELLRQRTLISSLLVTSTDCNNTLGCIGSELRELRDSEGRILVNALGTSTYGPYQVQAQCQADKTIEIRVSSYVNGQPRKHPITKQPMDLTSKSGILLESAMLCGKLDKNSVPKQIMTLNSARCTKGNGTCALPAEYVGTDTHMCCEDGSDIPKPVCPTGYNELSSHWDRDNDWGMEGSWVVLCG